MKGLNMGAWGSGIFENDSALDWVGDLLDNDDPNFINITLKRVIKESKQTLFARMLGKLTNVIEEPFASEALAAAEVLAYINGSPNSDLPPELADWIEANREKIDHSLVEVARRVVNIIKEQSELRDLWEESDELESWIENVESLGNRLA